MAGKGSVLHIRSKVSWRQDYEAKSGTDRKATLRMPSLVVLRLGMSLGLFAASTALHQQQSNLYEGLVTLPMSPQLSFFQQHRMWVSINLAYLNSSEPYNDDLTRRNCVGSQFHRPTQRLRPERDLLAPLILTCICRPSKTGNGRHVADTQGGTLTLMEAASARTSSSLPASELDEFTCSCVIPDVASLPQTTYRIMLPRFYWTLTADVHGVDRLREFGFQTMGTNVELGQHRYNYLQTTTKASKNTQTSIIAASRPSLALTPKQKNSISPLPFSGPLLSAVLLLSPVPFLARAKLGPEQPDMNGRQGPMRVNVLHLACLPKQLILLSICHLVLPLSGSTDSAGFC
ncbi:uncharacterized protein CLUP02_10752 [Colletotrichum lupini]|uniref:Uncharacterized protein n=1 Tax=Colletotrichum lupini TaxID=145971 RepID=A0A9Q8SY40_9PEZI|nr:uncharacterized protein CLUP02_10752 [Colletotrichum lupini]UQC85255.1 hypothetical protein CLUP02_10752 [Colletotrichum lupini]